MTEANLFSSAKGEYNIGTTYFTWSWSFEDSQPEQYVGQIWYPADHEERPTYTKYLPETVYQTDLKYNPQIAELSSVITDASLDAPLLQNHAPYPALFFSPGLGLLRQQDTFMFEYLASRGFIIVSIDHPKTSMFTEKADGTFVLYDDTLDCDSKNGRKEQIEKRAEQLRAALDTILKLNNDSCSQFYKSIALNTIGAFGHSFGGVTALRASSIDKRFKTAINMDGGIGEGEIEYEFHKQDILLLMSPMDDLYKQGKVSEKEYQTYVALMKKFMTDNETSEKYMIYFNEVAHMNFTDWPLLWPNGDYAGTADAKKVLTSMSTMVNNFFKSVFSNQDFDIKNTIGQYDYARLIDVYSPE